MTGFFDALRQANGDTDSRQTCKEKGAVKAMGATGKKTGSEPTKATEACAGQAHAPAAAASFAPSAAVAKSSTRRSLLLVGALLAIALAAWGCMQFAFADDADERTAVVTDSAGDTHRIPLGEDGTYPIETELGKNVVVVEDGKAHMDEADCPGHDCIDQGAIGSAGEIIVCLPHKLIVTIEGADNGGSPTIDGMAS